MRLFIAIELPEETRRLLADVRTAIPGCRWVPAAQLHLTLSFLGDVDDVALGLLTHELATIRSPGFMLRFSGLGCFPDRRRPRVLWIGLEPEPLLNDLAGLVRKAVLACAIPQEERPFSPHITLARFKLPVAHEVATFLDQQPRRVEVAPLVVREFCLFRSTLTPAGALHTAIGSFPLLPPGA